MKNPNGYVIACADNSIDFIASKDFGESVDEYFSYSPFIRDGPATTRHVEGREKRNGTRFVKPGMA